MIKRLLLLTCLALSACQHHHQAPTTLTLPASAVDGAVAQAVATSDLFMPSAEWLSERWWGLFQDEQLAQFIQTALSKNPTVLAAQARIQAAKFRADQLRAGLLPQLSLSAYVNKETQSKTDLIPADTPGYSFTYTEEQLLLNFSYDLDLWGKKRNEVKALVSEWHAQRADEALARLTLSVALAHTYFQLQVAYARLALAQALLENRENYLQCVERRTFQHIDEARSLLAAQNGVLEVKQQILALQAEIEIDKHQLYAYLVSNFEEQIESIEIAQRPLPIVPLPQELSINLLTRRPDLVAQLWLTEAAAHRIDVAKAGFFPDVNILGFLGFQTIQFDQLFNGASGTSSIMPNLSVPIFSGGGITAHLNEREVAYDAAVHTYNDLVLQAVKEVLDGLSKARYAHLQLKEVERESSHHQQMVDLTEQRLATGLDSALDFFQQEQAALLARDKELLMRQETIQAILALIKALGGGYGEQRSA